MGLSSSFAFPSASSSANEVVACWLMFIYFAEFSGSCFSSLGTDSESWTPCLGTMSFIFWLPSWMIWLRSCPHFSSIHSGWIRSWWSWSGWCPPYTPMHSQSNSDIICHYAFECSDGKSDESISSRLDNSLRPCRDRSTTSCRASGIWVGKGWHRGCLSSWRDGEFGWDHPRRNCHRLRSCY